MTSGYMNCPKCDEQFQYADVDGVWTEFPEPWTCSKCGSSIVLDTEKGYGLKVVGKIKSQGAHKEEQ